VDSGPGTPKECRIRLFELFYQVPSAGGPSGACLGLSIAKEIVEEHGGKIWSDGTSLLGITVMLALRASA
jgi:two-component system, OmpR family, phosphate regulon sensor histidine kinase PhoR